MCGIAGAWSPKRQGPAFPAQQMAEALRHRGPDATGSWADETRRLTFAHSRLSIIDLTESGSQPMTSRCGRYTVTYNGEIYNFRDLKYELESLGTKFAGSSDTEVLLESVRQWGIQGAVGRFNGMFAFALWDRDEKILHLVRDRLGEKPLYYGVQRGDFLFSSELKALKVHPSFRGELDQEALALFLRFAYVPAPLSIYKGIRKLPPGCIVSLRSPTDAPDPKRYWSLETAVLAGARNPFSGTEAEAAEGLKSLLLKSVESRMVADVPLGAFLSGGIDSSTIVALMQAQSKRPVKTFTIGFEESGFNEAVDARAVASHLGCDHTELTLGPTEALAVVPKLPSMYDEPFADSSQIPTFLVSRLAKNAVTVALSGDGGDEVFGGYNRYTLAPDIWRRVSWIPPGVRGVLAKILRRPSPSQWETALGPFAPMLARYGRQGTFGAKFHKAASVLEMAGPDDLYRKLVSLWDNPRSLMVSPPEIRALHGEALPAAGFIERMIYQDTLTYLPDDILVKVDRASMAVSLETRVPFLDHRVVEFAWSLPIGFKARDGVGKRVLRRVLADYVPNRLIDRPKMGFGIPLAAWLRGPLQDWGESLLDERRIIAQGYLNPGPIRTLWRSHQKGETDGQHALWTILMFQAWVEAS